MRVFQEKLFVATRFRNSIVNININSNWLREIAESASKLVSIVLNELKGTTRNEQHNFVTRKSSFQSFVPWPWSVYVLFRIYADWHKVWLLLRKNIVKRNIRNDRNKGLATEGLSLSCYTLEKILHMSFCGKIIV